MHQNTALQISIRTYLLQVVVCYAAKKARLFNEILDVLMD